MARKKPNIDLAVTNLLKDRGEFQNFVLQVIRDTFIFTYVPDSISLDVETQRLFTVNLLNKRFVIDILEIDNIADYIDVYLFGVKQPQDRYSVFVIDTNIVIEFNVDITRLPLDVVASDFLVKGKIVEIE
jgi:hypothetical protein